MRIVITGGAGFIGSHLSEALLNRGDKIVCLDDLSTGVPANIAHLIGRPGFDFGRADISLGLPAISGQIDAVVHLASPASPPDYLSRPFETLAVGSRGTEYGLQLADRWGARFVLASTSEIYGDPLVHPQREEYWGNVNPIGPRSVYDEAKRFAEALVSAYQRRLGVNTGIARIFNTYGPRMRPQDGRVVTNFISQALRGDPLTVYGDGTQTRSFCYVDDLVRGLVAMVDSCDPGPINLGNPVESTILELAELVLSLTGSASPIKYLPLPTDDPTRRRPDISRAQQTLGWTPVVCAEDGLRQTIDAFRASLGSVGTTAMYYPTAARTGRTFYLDSAGNDDADGLTPRTAWRSVDRASKESLRPGDRLRLRGGERFPGMLHLESSDGGDANRPVLIDSFGDGRAIIEAQGNSAIYVHDTAGIEIRNLDLVGDPQSTSRTGGLVFYNDTATRLSHVVISGIDVSGFNNGIEIGAATVGFANVSISDAEVHGNVEAGLVTYGPPLSGDAGYAHENVTVSRVEAHDNSGDPKNKTRNTGSGILLGSVRGGRVEWSHAYENGWLCTAPEGPAGIWAYDSTAVVIEHNVAHHNRTGGKADGDGFDLDQNTSASIMQYNLSYDNDGAGFLVYAERPGTFNRDNVIRYNISCNSSRSSDWYGSIALMGQIENAQIYGNTLTMTASGDIRAPVVRMKGPISDVALRNNIFVSDGAGPIVDASEMTGNTTVLQSNDYYSPRRDWLIRWGATSYQNLEDWRAKTGQERDGKEDRGLAIDPMFVDPDAELTAHGPGDLADAQGMKLRVSSPLASAGINLRRFSIDPGTVDYFGSPLNKNSSDIGAHQLTAPARPPIYVVPVLRP